MKPAWIVSLLIGLLLAMTIAWKLSTRETAPDWQTRDTEMQELKAKMKSLSGKIKSAAGEGKCKTDSNCHAIGLGAKVCGGYHNFMVYSDEDAEVDKLGQFVDEFNQLAQKQHDLSLSVPNCGVAAAPIQCIKGRCTKVD